MLLLLYYVILGLIGRPCRNKISASHRYGWQRIQIAGKSKKIDFEHIEINFAYLATKLLEKSNNGSS